jgi:hypothetical protein
VLRLVTTAGRLCQLPQLGDQLAALRVSVVVADAKVSSIFAQAVRDSGMVGSFATKPSACSAASAGAM